MTDKELYINQLRRRIRVLKQMVTSNVSFKDWRMLVEKTNTDEEWNKALDEYLRENKPDLLLFHREMVELEAEVKRLIRKQHLRIVKGGNNL